MRKFLLSFFCLLLLPTAYSFAQGPWTQKATYPGLGRHRAFGFSIGNKGYIGGGWIGVQTWDDFWEYDPATNTWTQKAEIPTAGILSPTAFAIGTKGYFVSGLDENLNDNPDLWEFDPLNNTWTAKSPYPGFLNFNYGIEGFVIGTKAYVGEWGSGTMYIYNQPADQWTTTTTNFYFNADEIALTLNGKGYMATTQTGNQLWRYDPSTNLFTQLATMPAGGLTESSGFTVNGKIYVGTGQWFSTGERIRQFWEYNPTTNTWRGVNELPGAERDDATVFTIGNKGYLGTGTNGINMQDFWEFNPQYVTGVDEQENDLSVNIFPNPMEESATIEINSPLEGGKGCVFEMYDLQGKCVQQSVISDQQSVIHRGNLSAGNYIYKIISENKILATGKLIIQ